MVQGVLDSRSACRFSFRSLWAAAAGRRPPFSSSSSFLTLSLRGGVTLDLHLFYILLRWLLTGLGLLGAWNILVGSIIPLTRAFLYLASACYYSTYCPPDTYL